MTPANGVSFTVHDEGKNEALEVGVEHDAAPELLGLHDGDVVQVILSEDKQRIVNFEHWWNADGSKPRPKRGH